MAVPFLGLESCSAGILAQVEEAKRRQGKITNAVKKVFLMLFGVLLIVVQLTMFSKAAAAKCKQPSGWI